jgi:acetyltransferase
MLRVATIEHLFDAVKALANSKPVQRNHLLILGDSRGIGLLAKDMLLQEGGQLAAISPTTHAALTRIAPPGSLSTNPIDLGNRAGFKEYDQALALLLPEPGVDGLLIVHVPGSLELDQDVSRAIIARAVQSPRPVLVSWVGATPAAPAWQAFQDAGIAIYPTPEEAVWSCLQLAKYHRNQALLMETPSSIPKALARRGGGPPDHRHRAGGGPGSAGHRGNLRITGGLSDPHGGHPLRPHPGGRRGLGGGTGR